MLGETPLQDGAHSIKNSLICPFTASLACDKEEKPGFLKGISWPPIGPPAELGGEFTNQNIPARKRFCSWEGSDCE